jgi:hydroxymethylpyrimidine/phosphomethylpyrimidine kinase
MADITTMIKEARIQNIVALRRVSAGPSGTAIMAVMNSQPNKALVPTALTIAGSDSSGGAGLQADLKTFTRLGVYGMSVVTAVTAQNTLGVGLVTELAPVAVAAQLTAVLEDIPPTATKIGMLSSVGNVRTVIDHCSKYSVRLLVLDPVLCSSTGTRLLSKEGAQLMRSTLFPSTFLLTPNLDEAESLTDTTVRTPDQMEEAARALHGMGVLNVLVKGGHLEGKKLVDVFFDGRSAFRLVGDRIENTDCHGTGCVLSAAITAHLARGVDIESAVSRGQVFTRRAIRNGLRLGRGQGPCDPIGLEV